MQHGIYYAYWEHEWDGDYHYYIDKVSSLGFDILEIAAGPLPEYSDEELKELKKHAADKNIRLTVGYGPVPENNISSSDPAVRKHALEFYTDLFKRMEKIGATLIGGALYSCWPIDFSKPVDKKGDWERGIEGMAKLGRIAAECGIEVLGLESLNRFENHVINTSKECTAFVKSVRELEPKASNVSVMLDTFHMNIEEDNIAAAIRKAGDRLCHFHIGEGNRKVPGKGMLPWNEIGQALRDINYQHAAVMEPFVMQGGTVGHDIKIWRDIIGNCSEVTLDMDAQSALHFVKHVFEV